MKKWMAWLDTGVDYVPVIVLAATYREACWNASHIKGRPTWPVMYVEEVL